MTEFKHRKLASATFLGERVDFIQSNDRIQERVSNISHERDVLEKLSEVTDPNSIFWDVGSCLGIHSFILAKQLEEGEVISFEPMPANRAVSIDNKSVNELSNITITGTALSDSNGTAEFDIRESYEPGYGRHGLVPRDGETDMYDHLQRITVSTQKGDEIDDAPQPTVVKIDVEGASPLVLQGMEKILQNPACKHVILETHEPNPVQPSHEDFGYTRDDLISHLESLGFTVSTLDHEFHLYGQKTQRSVQEYIEQADPEVTAVQGDITSCSTDALVNSVGTSLHMGTGVSGAIVSQAGDDLRRAALEKSPATLGTAVHTEAPNLDAEHIFHAVSLPHYGDGKSTPKTIYTATVDALEKADLHECESISIPAVGCGLGGVTLSTGVKKILQAIGQTTLHSINDVQLVLYSDEEYQTITRMYNLQN